MASSELLALSDRLICFAGRSLPCGRGPEGPCFQLRILPSVPPSVPRQTGRPKDDSTSARDSLRPNVRGSASAKLPLESVHVGALTRLRSSLDAAARTVACPSPTRTFTFELSSHESPRWNVEHDYAGKSSISRGRTRTGWIRSLAGCTAPGAAAGGGAEVVAATHTPILQSAPRLHVGSASEK
jgi:hypothetical protein